MVQMSVYFKSRNSNALNTSDHFRNVYMRCIYKPPPKWVRSQILSARWLNIVMCRGTSNLQNVRMEKYSDLMRWRYLMVRLGHV